MCCTATLKTYGAEVGQEDVEGILVWVTTRAVACVPLWLFPSHVSKWLVLGQNWGRVRPRLPDCWFFPSQPAGYEKKIWFYLSRKPRLLWQPKWFPEWGKKKNVYFEPFLWNTYVLALSLQNVKENWENSATNLSCTSLVFLQCVFVSFQNS